MKEKRMQTLKAKQELKKPIASAQRERGVPPRVAPSLDQGAARPKVEGAKGRAELSMFESEMLMEWATQ